MTKAEKAHLDSVSRLGCIACEKMGIEGTPANLHHVRKNSERRNHFKTLPLCPIHHQTGGHGVAVHAGEETWEEIFGSQEDLLAEVAERIGQKIFHRKPRRSSPRH